MSRVHFTRRRSAPAAAVALALALCMPEGALADAPALIPIQGYLTESDGTPIAGDRSLAFGVYDVASGGSALYQETRTVSVVAGDFVVYLGEVTPLPLSLFRDEEELWLEVVIDATDVVTPRTRLATGPYAGLAQYCEGANTLDGNDATDFAQSVHNHSFASLTSIPAGLSDGDDDTDTLRDLGCSSGQIARRGASAWACGADNDALGALSCTTGQFVQRGASAFSCVTPATVAISGSYSDLSGVPSGLLSGSGTSGYLPRYSAATTLTNSTVFQSGTSVGVGITTPNVRLDVNGEVAWGTTAARANRLSAAEGGSIELGDTSVVGSRPYIDFHFGNPATPDFNVRLSNESDGELRVQASVLRMQSTSAGAANVSLGHVSNAITGGATSATISGGGTSGTDNANRVTDTGGTVSGGVGNRAGNDAGAASDVTYATVGGGYRNTASGGTSIVAGGNQNTAFGQSATIAGGSQNTAFGLYATIAGGSQNNVDGDSFIGGGSGNSIEANSIRSVIGGGLQNEGVEMVSSVIGGGSSNSVSQFYSSVIGGGTSNFALGAYYSVIGGGTMNAMDSGPGLSTDYCVIGGGYGNSMNGGVGNSTIAGGTANAVLANTYNATIGGGSTNHVSALGGTVSGGQNNIVGGDYGMIPGGYQNYVAGDYAFAAGRTANANQNGCFAWADSNATAVNCDAVNAWVARASGGVTFFSNAAMTTGVRVAAGGGAWAAVSDRALKRDIEPVDTERVLSAVERMPIATWRYTTEVSRARHMGPMAQDFHAAFGLGDDDKHIVTIDADGVALAAVQGLAGRSKTQAREVDALQREQVALRADVQALRVQNAELFARLERLEARGGGSPLAAGYSWLGWASTLLIGCAVVLGYRQRGVRG